MLEQQWCLLFFSLLITSLLAAVAVTSANVLFVLLILGHRCEALANWLVIIPPQPHLLAAGWLSSPANQCLFVMLIVLLYVPLYLMACQDASLCLHRASSCFRSVNNCIHDMTLSSTTSFAWCRRGRKGNPSWWCLCRSWSCTTLTHKATLTLSSTTTSPSLQCHSSSPCYCWIPYSCRQSSILNCQWALTAMSHTTNSGSGTILTLSYMAEGGRVLTSQVKVYNGKTTLVADPSVADVQSMRDVASVLCQ